ncbi:MAG: V-type ATPase 116kDa subunit family protein [Xenococcaceae cyanobacterium MO_167.B52]|nr:V-type ATPase 116kDa subunit family protein [Xenococcaceae cyanobacterium MO_167.B52]
MTIVPLKKVTVLGLKFEQEAILEGLQCLGCMHLIPLQPPAQELGFGLSDRYKEAQEALRHIMEVPRRRHQVREETNFNLDEVVTAALANKQQLREAEDQKLFLTNRLKKLAPWGNFTLPDLNELGGYRLWFYQVPHTKAKQIQKLELPWQIMGKDHLHVYLVVIAQKEPPANILPVPRTHAGSVSPKQIKNQLEQLEIQLDEIRAEHEALSRWIFLLSKNLARVEDQSALQNAIAHGQEQEGIFMVQGWMAERSLKQLNAFAEKNQLAFLAEPVKVEDTPPTLMDNPPTLRGGQDLVTFYETPGYRTWDPSSVVFFSFALFFAMILSDAGYALVLAIIVACFWQQMGKSRGGSYFRILTVVGLSLAIIYGILVGSYFGIEPSASSWLAKLKLLNLQDYNSMMQFSLTIGCLHLAFANGIIAYQGAGLAGKSKPLGWIAVIFGGLSMYQGDQHLGIGLLAGGFLIIFLGGCIGSKKPFPLQIIDGLGSLIGVSKLFGDVMSYLRLFALGLASASLAITFNQLAEQVYQTVPGLGLLLSILIVILGHGINLLLAVISGFVHGLRLNFIEFFNWGLTEEGYPFQAFAKKESNL